MKNLKLIVLLSIMMLNISPKVWAQQGRAVEELSDTAQVFFKTWLLKRDVNEALTYVSSKPVLSSCMTPDEMEGKKTLTHEDILGVFNKVFTAGLLKTSKVTDLSAIIDSSQHLSIKDPNINILHHSFESYFQIFHLKRGIVATKIAYICKFDARKCFRERVYMPDVYYMITTVKISCPNNEVCSASLEFLWVKEGDSWRILTVSALED